MPGVVLLRLDLLAQVNQ